MMYPRQTQHSNKSQNTHHTPRLFPEMLSLSRGHLASASRSSQIESVWSNSVWILSTGKQTLEILKFPVTTNLIITGLPKLVLSFYLSMQNTLEKLDPPFHLILCTFHFYKLSWNGTLFVFLSTVVVLRLQRAGYERTRLFHHITMNIAEEAPGKSAPRDLMMMNP